MAMDFWGVTLLPGPLPIPPAQPGTNTGAVVDFLGVVRGLEGEVVIHGIEYEAFAEMAVHQMQRLAQEAIEQFHLSGLLLFHRIGMVPAGEPSLFLRVASSHRQAAFQASQWIVDQLKQCVPIWKKPVPPAGVPSPAQAGSL